MALDIFQIKFKKKSYTARKINLSLFRLSCLGCVHDHFFLFLKSRTAQKGAQRHTRLQRRAELGGSLI